jgi:excisionase family DNA binding protein
MPTLTPPNDSHPILTPQEVADLLRVEVSWVYRAAREGTIPSLRLGRYVRFSRADLDRFIADGGSSHSA